MAEGGPHFYDWQLSERAKKELDRNWPNLTTAALEEAGRIFRGEMSILQEGGEAEWAQEIARLAKTSQDFLAELESARWSVYSFRRARIGSGEFWLHELATRVTRIFARMATGYLTNLDQTDRRGATGPRTKFILTVRKQLYGSGYGVSKRPNDDLLRVLDLMFCEVGYPVSDTRKTVAHVLDRVGIECGECTDRFPLDV